MNFSAILMVRIPRTNIWFKLRRYNGRHEHTNTLEKEKFRAFHIHQATERYQELGSDEELYATATERYTTIEDALDCMLDDCSFAIPEKQVDPGYPLFEEQDDAN